MTAYDTFESGAHFHWDAPLGSYRCERDVPGLYRYEDGEWTAVPGTAEFSCSTLTGFRLRIAAYAQRLNLF